MRWKSLIWPGVQAGAGPVLTLVISAFFGRGWVVLLVLALWIVFAWDRLKLAERLERAWKAARIER